MVILAEGRERINENRHAGVFYGWKKAKDATKFGWIQLINKIKHEKAERNSGRVFMTENDLDGIAQEDLKKGSNINFVIYADTRGLGAEEIRLSNSQNHTLKDMPIGNAKKNPQGVIQTIQKKKNGQQQQQKQQQIEGVQPVDKSSRVRISPGRLTGVIQKFKGAAAWIKPDMPMPGVTKPTIYLHQADYEGPLDCEIGMQVDFFVYSDATESIGAEHCRSKGKKQNGQQAVHGVIQQNTKQAQKKKKQKSQNKTGEPKVTKERERIMECTISGQVMEWKGKFGWIQPLEPIDHPEASKNKGRIYVTSADLEGVDKLAKQQMVELYVYTDGKGLGGEEVKVA